jgi:fatty aldehyde-generating acyl-ACP reductase
MDSQAPSIDFAIIGHQDSWQHITALIHNMRMPEQEKLSVEKIKGIFSFIPPRDIFKIKAQSKTGTEVNGVYIETFIDPDRLGAAYTRANISKVMNAVSFAKNMGAKVVTLGGFTSIVLEGNLDALPTGETKFTTGNTLTAAYIVKRIEQAAILHDINLAESSVLIIGATGDIGMACTAYLKNKVQQLLLSARNQQRLERLAQALIKENIAVAYSVSLQDLIPEADIIIGVASSTGIELAGCKKNVLICDAGYPKNLETTIQNSNELNLFHGGMGQISRGYSFSPDYTTSMYHHEAPHISHGCVLEAIVLAMENKFETYSAGKGNITIDKMEEIYNFSLKHGVVVAPFYNANGLWQNEAVVNKQFI